MFLITGGTGFIGRALLRQLSELEYPVRTLIRPSPRSPNLPRGVSTEVAVSSLTDERGLRAAMVGVDTVFHLASGEWHGPSASLFEIDIRGTRAVIQAAGDAGVERILFISHLGADRASAYPVLKSKAITEEFIRRSGIKFTIIRSAIVFGPNDGLTTGIARIGAATPFSFLLPGDGTTLLQPLWIEDLVTCLVWSLDNSDTINRTYEVGGPEYLTFRQISELVLREAGLSRRMVRIGPPYLRTLTVVLEAMFPALPVSVYWLDYLAANRTTALDTLPRSFNLMPSRFSQRLAYLRGVNWRAEMFKTITNRP